MLFVALAPVIYLTLQNRILALIVLCSAYCMTLFYPHGSINSATYTFSFYFTGAFAGTYLRDIVVTRQKRSVSIGAILIIASTLTLSMINSDSYIFAMFKISWAVLIWFAMDIIEEYKKPADYMKIAFFIYCAHEYFIRFFEKIIWKLLPSAGLLNILLTIILVLLAASYCAKIMKKYTPKIWLIMNGGRG